MSELIKQWESEESDHSFESWRVWYLRKRPQAVEEATRKVKTMLENMKQAMDDVDDETIRSWVEDLVITNTYVGLRLQDLILKKLASDYRKPLRHSTPAEESKGIDGFIGDIPVSVKPSTYKLQETWVEKLGGFVVYYSKEEDEVKLEVPDGLLKALGVHVNLMGY